MSQLHVDEMGRVQIGLTAKSPCGQGTSGTAVAAAKSGHQHAGVQNDSAGLGTWGGALTRADEIRVRYGRR